MECYRGHVYLSNGFAKQTTDKTRNSVNRVIVVRSSRLYKSLNWDDEISLEDRRQWDNWMKDLQCLQKLSIERCTKPMNFGDVTRQELHVFSDASSLGYGCSAYLRQCTEKDVHVSLLVGKSRLAPIKTLTIPRLELTAATVAVRIGQVLMQELDLNIDSVVYYTDSMTVLHYIKNEKRRFPVFVTNRIRTIRDFSTPDQWRVDDGRLLQELEARLHERVKPDTPIDFDTFKSVFNIRDAFMAKRFFALVDTDGSGSVEASELTAALRLITFGSSAEKLKFLFDIYDESGDGSIDVNELRQALASCIVESSIKLGEDDLDMLTQALFDEADEDHNGSITLEELEHVVGKHPGLRENLSLSAEHWLRPVTKSKQTIRHLTKHYFINNRRKIIFLFLLTAINVALFVVGCWNYRFNNWWIILARGGGLCLDFDCTMTVFLVLRNFITFLRQTPLRHILPLDQNVMFHKFVGLLIFAFSVEHTVMHVGNAVATAHTCNLTVPEFIFTTRADIGWLFGLAPVTGVVLVIILVVIMVCSLPIVRERGNFEMFYISHMLYLPFWVILIIHATHFWKWFIVAGLQFILEKLARSKLVKHIQYGKYYIREVVLFPNEVTHLVIARPQNMTFRPGDYIYLQIPAIARYEWHPFTISSAPEMEDSIWLHIRSVGSWTRKLHDYFSSCDDNESNAYDNAGFTSVSTYKSSMRNRLSSVSSVKKSLRVKSAKSFRRTLPQKTNMAKFVNIKCYIDGPYGTASRGIFESEHAVLIGSGIGVTPFASILQSIMLRLTAVKRSCPNCRHSWYDDDPEHVLNLKKVDFIWINRNQKSFEWFLSLLAQLELEQSMEGGLGNFLELHMYMTSALNKTDLKGIALQMALELIHEDQNKDLLTGLRTRTQPGRPDFHKIAAENRGQVRVFFCGNSSLAKTIKNHCSQFGFNFSKETF